VLAPQTDADVGWDQRSAGPPPSKNINSVGYVAAKGIDNYHHS
jgi:hypothetical protein